MSEIRQSTYFIGDGSPIGVFPKSGTALDAGKIYVDANDSIIWLKRGQPGDNTAAGWSLVAGGGSSTTVGISTPLNWAAAKALSMDPVPVISFVQGEITPGNGGGIYVWDATSTAADDFFTAISLTANGANPGRLVRIPFT